MQIKGDFCRSPFCSSPTVLHGPTLILHACHLRLDNSLHKHERLPTPPPHPIGPVSLVLGAEKQALFPYQQPGNRSWTIL